MMASGMREWCVALTVAAVLHLALAIALFWQMSPSGAVAPGVGGIEISLGAAGGAAGGAVNAAESIEIPEIETPIETIAAPAEAVEPPPEPVTEPILEPVETPEQENVTEPEPIPEHAVAITQTQAPRSIPAASTQPSQASTVGADGRAGATQGEVGNTENDNQTAGGRAGAAADYPSLLLAWLEPYKEYPSRARARRQQGVVRLFIAIARNGNVLDARIESSAGSELLDQASLDMLERAAPLPPLPDDIAGERYEIIVPVHFYMKR